MKPMLTLGLALATALLLSACTQEQPPAEKKAEPAVQIPQSPTVPSEQMAEKAEKEIQEMTASAREQTEQAATAVKEGAAEVAEKTEEVVTEAAQETKEMASDAVQTAKEEGAKVMGDEKAPAPASPALASMASGPVVVEYEASMGKVTFNHAEHAGRVDCGKCHPTHPPEKIAIDKEVAHNQLCKVCHKESGGNAPTGCTGCHKK